MRKSLLILLSAGALIFGTAGLNAQCVIFNETFDNSLGQFTVTLSANGSWIFTNSCSQSGQPGHSGPGSAIFSGNGCQFGNFGNAVIGHMTSPSIIIPASGSYELSFNYYIRNECGNTFQNCSYDILAVQISTDGVSYVNLASSNIAGQLPMQGGWNKKIIDMSPYAGNTVTLRFFFNSVDGLGNAFDGIYVDDVTVAKLTPGPVNTISGPSVFCEGSLITLTSSSASNNLWSTGDTTQSITVSVGGFYTLQTSLGIGCIPAGSDYVAVVSNPLSEAVNPFDTTICKGATVSLTASNAGSAAGRYQWFDDITSITPVHTGQTLPPQQYNTNTSWYVEFRDSIVPKTGKYYLRTSSNEPWFSLSNPNAMDTAFGVGNWTLKFLETVNVSDMLDDAAFIFIDGSDLGAGALSNFLDSNLADLEAWVISGGNLFINAAPSGGSSINLGFVGSVLVYPYFSSNVTSNIPSHPIFNTPAVTGTNFSGINFGHAHVTGTGFTKLLVNSADTTKMVLGFKNVGNGRVMFGGMTTNNFHSPQPQATQLRSNILTFMYQPFMQDLSDCPAPRALYQVNVTPNVSYNQTQTSCLQGGNIPLQGGTPAGGVYTISGVQVTELVPTNTGVGNVTVTYTYTDGNGCSDSANSVITIVDCANINESAAGSLSVYPNPTAGLLNIEASGGLISEVEVISITGKVIYSANVNSSAAQVNINHLSKGVYMVRVKQPTGNSVHRIILR
jgi:hypothetical protein